MTLEDRLERLAARTPPGDPADILARARAQAEAPIEPRRSSSRLLAAAAVVAVLVLGAGALALTGDDRDSVTVAGPQSDGALDGQWTMTATVTDGEIRVTQGKASLTVDGDTVVLDDGCGNRMQATLVDGRAVWDGSRNDVGCADEQAADDADRFAHVIEQQPQVETRERELWLVADDGDALVFHRPDAGQADPTGGVDGPVMYAPRRDSDVMQQALVAGRLIRDGDCLFVDSGDGGTYLLLWPHGTSWDDDPEGVWVPGGAHVPVDGTFSAAGGYTTVEFLAEAGHHPDVVQRSRTCAPGAGEVAHVQGEFKVAEGEVPPGPVPAPLVTRTGRLTLNSPDGSNVPFGPDLGETDRPGLAAGNGRAFATVSAGRCGHDVIAVPYGDNANDLPSAAVVKSSAVAPSVSPSANRLAVIREDECEPTGLVEVGDTDGSGAVTVDLNADGDGLPFTALELAWAADDRLLILARMGETADSYSYWVIEYRIDGSTAEYRHQAYTDELGSTWLAVAADGDDGFYALTSENDTLVVRHVVFTAPGEPTESTVVADLGEFDGGDIAYDPRTDTVAVASTTMLGAGLRVVSDEQVIAIDVPGQGVAFVP